MRASRTLSPARPFGQRRCRYVWQNVMKGICRVAPSSAEPITSIEATAPIPAQSAPGEMTTSAPPRRRPRTKRFFDPPRLRLGPIDHRRRFLGGLRARSRKGLHQRAVSQQIIARFPIALRSAPMIAGESRLLGKGARVRWRRGPTSRKSRIRMRRTGACGQYGEGHHYGHRRADESHAVVEVHCVTHDRYTVCLRG